MTGIRNAFGFGRKRGGAGAVAAALAVCAIMASLSISEVHGIPIRNNYGDEIPDPVDDTEPPVKIPVIQEPTITYNGATPERLPC